jgi:hypothetical protein
MALKRASVRDSALRGLSDVPDFLRDVQPILDRHCAACHNPLKRAGNLNLAAAVSPRFPNAYLALLLRARSLTAVTGWGNQPPRSIGSSASPLLTKLLSGDHHGVKPTPAEWRAVWLWIEAAAPFAGSYAALRNTEGQGYYGHAGNKFFGECRDVFRKRCFSCHPQHERPQRHRLSPSTGVCVATKSPSCWDGRKAATSASSCPTTRSPHVRLRRTRELHRPEYSSILLAPLAKEPAATAAAVSRSSKNKNDPYYVKMLASIENGKKLFEARPLGYAGLEA